MRKKSLKMKLVKLTALQINFTTIKRMKTLLIVKN